MGDCDDKRHYFNGQIYTEEDTHKMQKVWSQLLSQT
jgi:hypothetical protein